MVEKIKQALESALEFKGINPSSITNVDYNVGGIWFTSNNKRYFILIEECDNY